MNWSEWLVNDGGSILIRIQLISRHFVALILYSLCTAGKAEPRPPAAYRIVGPPPKDLSLPELYHPI